MKATPAGVVGELLNLCALSESRFACAAKLAPTPELGFLFHDLSRQRASFAQELRSHLGRLTGSPQGDHAVADLHASVGDYNGALRFCIEHEEKIKLKYADALLARMPSELQALLYRHQAYVLSGLDRLFDLTLPAAA